MKDTVKIDRKNCRVVAHRGASSLERENSLAAFVAAGNRSYYGIETDIHPTLDGKLVIIHDENTGRVAFEDVNVEKCTYEELKSVRLKDLDGGERNDLCLPLLEEYLHVARDYAKHCFIELKGEFSREHIVLAVNTVKEHYSLDNVTFISFELSNLVFLRELLPEQSIQYLTVDINEDIFNTLKRYSLGLDVLHCALNAEWVQRLHAENIEINCWTVDEATDASALVEMGVDFITSNRLE